MKETLDEDLDQELETSQPAPAHVSSSLETLETNSKTPSMVSNWIAVNYIAKQAPGSITSMVSHCAKQPSPGDSFLSMEEVLAEMKQMFENFWKT